jgi:CubicO group peptidase (beta-lactamase class C family)
MTACSSSHQATPPRSTSPTDPVAAAIAADFNSYTTDDQIRAIIVTVDGRTRFERYYASSAGESRNIFSVTKSVISTLIGLAISEGRLRLNERLSQMLPRYAADMTPRVARVTLRQLLTHTAGFPDASSTYDIGRVSPPDWVRYILKRQDSTPGEEFHYSNYGVHLLSPILVQATGQSVLTYARTHLFNPLGIPTTPAAQPLADQAHLAEYERAGFAWPVDPQGFHTAASDLKLRPQDMVRFGRLFLQAGQWNGRQVVPGSWVRQATTAQAGTAFTAFTPYDDFRPTGYGYLWWVTTADHTAAFFALGYGGQLIEVVPQRHLVIVISTYVDPKTGNEMVNGNDLQRLANAIVTGVRRR